MEFDSAGAMSRHITMNNIEARPPPGSRRRGQARRKRTRNDYRAELKEDEALLMAFGKRVWLGWLFFLFLFCTSISYLAQLSILQGWRAARLEFLSTSTQWHLLAEFALPVGDCLMGLAIIDCIWQMSGSDEVSDVKQMSVG